ncbi:MAG: lipid IV(A) palmitoyltransferase PagP, partial [Betaproteobacteria bacterium]
MNFPSRRKPLAQLICFGFAGFLAGSTAMEALAQSAVPLRVDPVLLGLPPITPDQAPAPARPAVAKTPVEIKPVEAPVVESRPARIEPESVRPAEAVKASPVAPVEPPVVVVPAPKPAAPVPVPAVAPAPAPARLAPVAVTPPQEYREPVRSQAPVSAPVVQQPVRPVEPVVPRVAPAAPTVPPPKPDVQPSPVSSSGSGAASTSSLAPLRVDPALLGLPPLQAVAPAVVESRPVRRELEPNRSVASPAVVIPVPDSRETVRAPAAVQSPARAVETAVQNPVPVVATQGPATRPVAPTYSVSSSSLPPLRVDPALLGLPPDAMAASAPSQGQARVALAPLSRRPVNDTRPWYKRLWAPVADSYDNGTLEFYLPFETYHLRSKYTAEKIATYQEKPKGFGVGRGHYDAKGNWEGVYALAFQDSHFMPMYFAGYGWKSIWRPAEDTRLGLGYVAGLMSRTDILHYVPFPIALPVASVSYKNFSLEGTYIPGGRGFGNIFFLWAKWELGKNNEPVGTPAKPEPSLQNEMIGTTFGPAVPLYKQRVPYGPALDVGGTGGTSGVAGAGATGVVGGVAGATGSGRFQATQPTTPPQVAATGRRDEEEVPDVMPALALRSSRAMVPQAKDSAVPRPVFLSAYRMGGDVDREFSAEGDAELRKIGTVINSDQLTYWPIDDEVEAEGNVRLQQAEDVITGPKMRLKLKDQLGYFEQPSYVLRRQAPAGSKTAIDREFAERYFEQKKGDVKNSGFAMPLLINPATINSSEIARTNADGRGEADRIDFEGENQMRLTNGTYTTCAPGNNDWYAKAGDLKLDYDREVGEGKDGTIYFKDVPILHSPWLSFSLNNNRKSGFLAPSYGVTSESGLSLRLPYYWNIAPNRDATIATRVLSKRGLMVSSEFRYLESSDGGRTGYRGEARLEVLPSDKNRNNDNRYGMSWLHSQNLANGFSGMVNYNKVSDDNYFTDLSSNVVSTSQTQLLQQGMVSYGGGGWWNATANFQNYQTLQPDPKNPVLEQYRMLPQITVNARKPDLYFTDSSFLGQYTVFSKPKQMINGVATADPDGKRLVLYPQMALPFVTPGWYVTPKVGLNMRQYSLTGMAAGQPNSINTTVPIVSVDSGMNFERNSRWFGRDYTQTLEPRLYYLNVPNRDQSNIPLFDTGLADFNFAQIFSENLYSGWDRISSANQLTAAATTRLLEPNTGSEIMRAMLGQRFYFSKNLVALNSTTPTVTDDRKWDKSDFLAAFSGQVFPRVYADLASQYNVQDKQLKRYSMGVRYLPEPGKVLNLAYRYNRDETAPVDQVDFSGQWPITGRWYGV